MPCLFILISDMTYNVLMGTLNPAHSLTHSLTLSVCPFVCPMPTLHRNDERIS